jgi:hypothetical protein
MGSPAAYKEKTFEHKLLLVLHEVIPEKPKSYIKIQ